MSKVPPDAPASAFIASGGSVLLASARPGAAVGPSPKVILGSGAR
jgi:hypothetical protein